MKTYTAKNLYEDKELLDLAKARNYIPAMSQATSFPINAGGRAILVGVDIDPERIARKDYSLNIHVAKGDNYIDEGFSVNGDKEAFKQALVKQFRKMLDEMI